MHTLSYTSNENIVVNETRDIHFFDEEIEVVENVLVEDEKLTPSHEDLILLNVLMLLHPKLPAYIKDKYSDKIGKQKRLMDFKTEILTKAKSFIEDIDEADTQVNHIELHDEQSESK